MRTSARAPIFFAQMPFFLIRRPLTEESMRAKYVLFVAAIAAAPACAFQPGPLPISLRGSSAVRGVQPHSARMCADPDAYCVSRRFFFKEAIGGATALTIGSLGIEVPQSYADGLPAVSAPAPSFSLPSNTGKNIGLDDLKGKWGVLYFYPGDFTSGCTIEAQNFEKGSGIIRGLGAEIYGVSVDSLAKHLDFSKKYGLSFALLSDAEGKVSEQYGSALKIPFMGTFSNRQTYLIDPAGNLS